MKGSQCKVLARIVMPICVCVCVCGQRGRDTEAGGGYLVSSAYVTNGTREVSQVLIYLLAKIPLFQSDGQVRLIAACVMSVWVRKSDKQAAAGARNKKPTRYQRHAKRGRASF